MDEDFQIQDLLPGKISSLKLLTPSFDKAQTVLYQSCSFPLKEKQITLYRILTLNSHEIPKMTMKDPEVVFC